MTLVTVTWMTGQTEVYSSVPKWQISDGCLLLGYELEDYVIPLANVRQVKMEKA